MKDGVKFNFKGLPKTKHRIEITDGDTSNVPSTAKIFAEWEE